MPTRKVRNTSPLDPEVIADAAGAASEAAARARADTIDVLNRLGRRLTAHIAEYAGRDDGDVDGALPAVRDLADVLSVLATIGARQAAAATRGRAMRTAVPSAKAARPGWYIPRRRSGGFAARPAWWDGQRWWPAPTQRGAGRRR